MIRGISLLALVLCQTARPQTVQYSYDNLWRLTRAVYNDGSTIEYVYDNAGNRLMKSATPPPGPPPNHPPAAVSNPGIANGAVNVSATPLLTWPATTDPDKGNAVAYFLYFGPTPNPPLVYSGWETNWSPGQLECFTTYFWYVVARDNHNATSTSPVWSFTTGDVAPRADFSVEPASGAAPFTVSFQDQSQYRCGTLTSWQWDFYNRGVVDTTNHNPLFTYTAAGNYTVRMVVGDEHGGVATVVKTNVVSVLGSNIINLAVLDLNIESAGPERHLVVSYTVTNAGSLSLVGKWQWPDVFYLSSDTVLDSSASMLTEFDESQVLAAGAVYWRTNMVTMPDTDLSGQYLWLNVDDNNQLEEGNLADNAFMVPADTRLPDLVPGNLAAQGQAVAGQLLNVSYSVTNAGTLDISGPFYADVDFYDGFYLSTNSTWDSTATDIGDNDVSGTLASGAGYTQTASVTLPVWPAGNYFLILVANDGDTIVESDNSNNTLSIPLTMSAPDLAAIALAAPAKPASDATIPIVYAVTNQGNAVAIGPWTDSLYLSTNAVLDDQAYSLGDLDQPGPLSPQSGYTATNLVQLPGWPAGTYYLMLQVDSSGDVPDAARDNNLLVIPFTLQAPVGPPDLVPISILAPASAMPGAFFQVVYAVTNTGGNPLLGDWSDELWFSANPVLDDSATPLDTQNFTGPLPGWATYHGTNTVALPSAPAGVYYLIIQANASGSGNEVTLTNNDLAVSILYQAIKLSPSRYLTPAGFQLAVTGAIGASYTLWVSTDLTDWQSAFDFTCTNQPTWILDPDAIGLDTRFYYVTPSAGGP